MKNSLIAQIFQLFQFIKICNIEETKPLIFEYFELIKLVLKTIRSVSNKIDYEFIKNISISIEYIKQRFNFKISDDDLFNQLLTIIDTSLYELKITDEKIKNSHIIAEFDGYFSQDEIDEIKKENIKNTENIETMDWTKSYYKFDKELEFLSEKNKKYNKQEQNKSENENSQYLDFEIVYDNTSIEQYNQFENRCYSKIYNAITDKSIFYLDDEKDKEKDDEELEENNKKTKEESESPESKVKFLIKLISKALLSTQNNKIFTDNFLGNNINYFIEIKNSIPKIISKHWSNLQITHHKLMLENNNLSLPLQKIQEIKDLSIIMMIKISIYMKKLAIYDFNNLNNLFHIHKPPEFENSNDPNSNVDVIIENAENEISYFINEIWVCYQELYDIYSSFIKSENSNLQNHEKSKLLIKMMFFKTGILNMMHSSVDLCFVYFKFCQKYALNLVEIISKFLELVFADDPFSLSLLLKRGVFDIVNKNIKDQSFYYDNDYSISTIYKQFVQFEIQFIERMIETVREKVYKVSYYSFLRPILKMTVNNYQINHFSKKTNKVSHRNPIFYCNGEKRLKFNKEEGNFVVDTEYLICNLFDTLKVYHPKYDNLVKTHNIYLNQIQPAENDEKDETIADYKAHPKLSISIYKLIKEICSTNCFYDFGDLLNDCLIFFSSFIEKYLYDDFIKIQDLEKIVQGDHHQVAELTVIMIGVLNHLPEDSTSPILKIINIPTLQKLLYWLEEDLKNYKYIRTINEAILRKLIISYSERSQKINFNYHNSSDFIENSEPSEQLEDELDKIEIYSVSNTQIDTDEVNLNINNNNVEPNEMESSQKKYVYKQVKYLESYLFGEYIKILINDFAYYLQFDIVNTNSLNVENNRITRLANDSLHNQSTNGHESKNNIIFIQLKHSCKYFIEVIWTSVIEILKSIIYNSPTLTPILIGYFNKNLIYFLKGFVFFIKRENDLSKVELLKLLLIKNYFNLVFAVSNNEIQNKINEFILLIEAHIEDLKNFNIEKSLTIFKYYLEIMDSKYHYSDLYKLDVPLINEHEIDFENYEKNYDIILKSVQKEIITDLKNEKYMITTRKNLVDNIYEFLIITSKILYHSTNNDYEKNTEKGYVKKLAKAGHNTKDFEVDTKNNEILKGSNLVKTFNFIFKADPDSIQKYLVTERKEWLACMIKICINNLNEIMKKNFISHKIDMSHKDILVNSFIDQLEFLRLLCENHNKLFQYIIIKYDRNFLANLLSFSNKILITLNLNYENLAYLNILDKVTENKENLIVKIASLNSTFKLKEINILKTSRLKENYLNADKLFEIIFSFLIEVVQGASLSTFKYMFEGEDTDTKYFDCFYQEFTRLKENIIEICNDKNFTGHKKRGQENISEGKYYSNMTIFKLFNEFIRFTTQCLDEPNNDIAYKEKILSKFDENQYIKLLKVLYKRIIDLYYFDNNIELNLDFKSKYNANNNLKNIEKLEAKQNELFFQLFLNLGLFTKNSINIKVTKGELKLKDKIKIINKREDEEDIYLLEQTNIFIERIICRVEINYQDVVINKEDLSNYDDLVKNYLTFNTETFNLEKFKEEEKKAKSSIIKEALFFKSAKCFYLKKKDSEEIMINSTLDVYKQRLVDFVEKVEFVNENIEIRKKIDKELNKDTFKKFSKIPYDTLIIYSTIISAIINILMISYSTTAQENPIEPSLVPIGNFVETELTYYNSKNIVIVILGIIQLLFLLVSISSWVYVKLNICILEDEIENKFSTYEEDIKEKRSKYLINIVARVWKKLRNEVEVLLLIWNLVFGILGFVYPIFYSLQLLSVIFIVTVMRTVLLSFLDGDRYKQFLAMGVMISITLFIYAFFSFYFFQDRFEDDDLGENTCKTPLMCFLTLFNQGLRSGEGPSFGIKPLSEDGFWAEFAFTWTFYFALILIMISIINGIIVDAFQDLRSKENTKKNIINNNCFICDLDSTTLEVDGINFENHIKVYHSIEKYLEYLIHIVSTNESELNSVESFVKGCIKISDTSFFPNKVYFKA